MHRAPPAQECIGPSAGPAAQECHSQHTPKILRQRRPMPMHSCAEGATFLRRRQSSDGCHSCAAGQMVTQYVYGSLLSIKSIRWRFLNQRKDIIYSQFRLKQTFYYVFLSNNKKETRKNSKTFGKQRGAIPEFSAYKPTPLRARSNITSPSSLGRKNA